MGDKGLIDRYNKLIDVFNLDRSLAEKLFKMNMWHLALKIFIVVFLLPLLMLIVTPMVLLFRIGKSVVTNTIEIVGDVWSETLMGIKLLVDERWEILRTIYLTLLKRDPPTSVLKRAKCLPLADYVDYLQDFLEWEALDDSSDAREPVWWHYDSGMILDKSSYKVLYWGFDDPQDVIAAKTKEREERKRE